LKSKRAANFIKQNRSASKPENVTEKQYMMDQAREKYEKIDTEKIVKRTFLALRDTLIAQIRYYKTQEAIKLNIDRK
jgi:hypothetical protein